MSDQQDMVTVVALQPIGRKEPGANNLTIYPPGSEVEVTEHEAKQLVAEGSAAEEGSKEAKAAERAAKAEEADGADDDDDGGEDDSSSSARGRSSGAGKKT